MRGLFFPFFIMVVAACGRLEKREAPRVNPGEQQLKVGFESLYLLDPSQSDSILKSSTVTWKVVTVEAQSTTFSLRGKVNTAFGPQQIEIVRAVPNEVLNISFVDQLRSIKTFKGADFWLDYLSKTGSCDLIKIHNIKDYDWIKINATFCQDKKNVPKIQAEFKFFGQKMRATYLLKN